MRRGQNSFLDYFRELLDPVTAEYMSRLFDDTEAKDLYVSFTVDGGIAALMRWISDPEPVSANEFIRRIHSFVYGAANAPDEFPA